MDGTRGDGGTRWLEIGQSGEAIMRVDPRITWENTVIDTSRGKANTEIVCIDVHQCGKGICSEWTD